MKQVIGLKEANHAEFYDIIDVYGIKSIHILCYYYQRDINLKDKTEQDENGDPKTWARIDGTFIIEPLDVFIKRFSEEGGEYLDNELWAETKQYQYDMSEKSLLKELECDRTIVSYDEITQDIPYGSYISLS